MLHDSQTSWVHKENEMALHRAYVTVNVWNQVFHEITNICSHFVKLLFHSGIHKITKFRVRTEFMQPLFQETTDPGNSALCTA